MASTGITDYVLPIIIGATAALLIQSGLQHITFHLYPLPADTDMYDADSATKAMKAMPVNAFYLQLVNYAMSSFLGGIIATLIIKRESRAPALVVGIILTLGGIINALILHEPTWFFICSLFTYLPFTLLAYLLIRKKPQHNSL